MSKPMSQEDIEYGSALFAGMLKLARERFSDAQIRQILKGSNLTKMFKILDSSE